MSDKGSRFLAYLTHLFSLRKSLLWGKEENVDTKLISTLHSVTLALNICMSSFWGFVVPVS